MEEPSHSRRESWQNRQKMCIRDRIKVIGPVDECLVANYFAVVVDKDVAHDGIHPSFEISIRRIFCLLYTSILAARTTLSKFVKSGKKLLWKSILDCPPVAS